MYVGLIFRGTAETSDASSTSVAAGRPGTISSYEFHINTQKTNQKRQLKHGICYLGSTGSL